MFRLNNLLRLKQIAQTMFSYELHHILIATDLNKFIPWHKRKKKSTDFQTQPETLRKVFQDLGGAFIKLGQLIALRPDLVGEATSKEFEKLLSTVPAIPFEEVKELFKEKGITKVQKKAIGSASIAQVYAATYYGKKVAIKIKRPGVDTLFSEDITIMKYLATKIKQHYPNLFVDPEDIISAFEEYTKKELDLRHEAANIKRFRKNFKNSKNIIIPKVYYSTQKILIMDFVEGKTIYDLKKPPKNLIKQITESVYKMIFEDRFFHADLHPGNIMVVRKKIAFLDFGIVGHVDQKMEEHLFKLFQALINGDLDKTAENLEDINIGNELVDKQILKDGLYNVLADYYDQPIANMPFKDIFYGAVEIATRAHIKLPAHLVLFGKSLITMEGFCKKLDPKFNVIANAKPVLRRILINKYKPTRMIKKIKNNSFEIIELIRNLPETTKEFSRKFTKIEERIINIDKTFQELTKVIWKVSKLLTFTMLFVAFFTASLVLLESRPDVSLITGIISTILFVFVCYISLKKQF